MTEERYNHGKYSNEFGLEGVFFEMEKIHLALRS